MKFISDAVELMASLEKKKMKKIYRIVDSSKKLRLTLNIMKYSKLQYRRFTSYFMH